MKFTTDRISELRKLLAKAKAINEKRATKRCPRCFESALDATYVYCPRCGEVLE